MTETNTLNFELTTNNLNSIQAYEVLNDGFSLGVLYVYKDKSKDFKPAKHVVNFRITHLQKIINFANNL